MINKEILSSVFESYKINNVIVVEENNNLNFVISNMSVSISLDRWQYLENILKDITGKNINLLTCCQVKNNLGLDYLKKGVVIR